MRHGNRTLLGQHADSRIGVVDNDLIVDDPAMLTAYCLSFPPGEQATPDEASAVAAAVSARCTDGPVKVRTRTGAFVCRLPRR